MLELDCRLLGVGSSCKDSQILVPAFLLLSPQNRALPSQAWNKIARMRITRSAVMVRLPYVSFPDSVSS